MVFRLISRIICSFVVFLAIPACLSATTISATIKDSTGAVIPHARVEIRSSELAQPIILTSDAVGSFASPDLKPGSYSLRVTADSFAPFEQVVEVGESPISLTLALSPSVAQQEITVAGKYAQYANSDSTYRALRNVGLGASFQVEGFTVKCDVASFELKQGTLTVLAPVKGRVTGAVFLGTGHFILKPVTRISREELKRRLGSEELDEDFTQIVFRYTGESGRALVAAMQTSTSTPPQRRGRTAALARDRADAPRGSHGLLRRAAAWGQYGKC